MNQIGSDNHSTSDLLHEHSISPGDTPIQVAVTLLDDREGLNLFHMELIIHLTQDKGIFDLGHVELGDVGVDDYFCHVSHGLQIGLESPYLLHQMLAFSARHLAFLHPERSVFYLHQAVALQTKAIALFTAAHPEPDRSNCVAIVLFASILGHHLFADTLTKRDPGGLAPLSNYVQCVEMHRGIYNVATTAWSLLQESELEPILSWSSFFTSQAPRGNHCQKIKDLIHTSKSLNDQEKEACRQAISYLQIGFEAVLDNKEKRGQRYQMIISWTMVPQTEFTALLQTRRPEALVLLSCYALMLHYGRSLWQVMDAGVWLLGIIGDYLGPEWQRWLEYPRRSIADDLQRGSYSC